MSRRKINQLQAKIETLSEQLDRAIDEEFPAGSSVVAVEYNRRTPGVVVFKAGGGCVKFRSINGKQQVHHKHHKYVDHAAD